MEDQIIIFDGECNLCNGIVSWLFNREHAKHFRLVPFQSPKGQALLKIYHFPSEQLTTVILIQKGNVYTHSEGFLKILEQVHGFYTIAKILQWVPLLFRDTIYKYASAKRLAWFGKSSSCTLVI